jgi:3,5-epimerase/4-reductase
VRVLILGGRGFLAQAFDRHLTALGDEAIRTHVDVTRRQSIENTIIETHADVVVNAAGKTHGASSNTIDGCEEDNGARRETMAVNVDGAKAARDACARRGVPLVHIGSGCVFDGAAGEFTEDSAPNPVSYYAETKVLGDNAVLEYEDALILRIRLPVTDEPHPRNTLVKLASYRSVVDARNSVTDVRSLVVAARQLLLSDHRGIFNVVNGDLSPYSVAAFIAETRGLAAPERLTPQGLNAITRAPRSNCTLSTAKLRAAGVRLAPAWIVAEHHVWRLTEGAGWPAMPSA